MQNHLRFGYKAPYSTLNELTSSTRHVWIACHGYGQLAERFIKRFDVFDPNEHFIIAPQGLSRFYLKQGYGEVGASWMTREDRETDMENQKSYFEAILIDVFSDHDLSNFNLNLIGFSQGVSMISRMVAHTRLAFDNLILWAGSFPPELTEENFKFVKADAKLKVVLGDQDQFFEPKKFQAEIDKMTAATGLTPQTIMFEGRHELNREVLHSLVK